MPADAGHGFGASDERFTLLRQLTPPVAAVTTSCDGRRNGFIVNSAQRASLVAAHARISFYCSKPNFSHDLMLRSGVFAVHLLRRDQWPVITELGLGSGRDTDKLARFVCLTGVTGCPVLADCVAGFECRVVNVMDAGAATFILGDVVGVHDFDAAAEIMTSEFFRAHMPAALRAQYEANLLRAQQQLVRLAAHVDPAVRWAGPTAAP